MKMHFKPEMSKTKAENANSCATFLSIFHCIILVLYNPCLFSDKYSKEADRVCGEISETAGALALPWRAY
jgi:hypothetical protein